MDKKAKKPVINKLRSDKLKAAVAKDKGPCPKCAAKDGVESNSPLKDMMQKLGMLGIPGLGNVGCDHAGPETPGAVVMRVVKIGEPVTGQKKVLEKDSKVTEAAHTSPFVQRCVAAITKGKPASREDESSAFAKCVSTKNKSNKDLDKSAEQRPGMTSRHKEFEKSLDKVRKHHDYDN